MWDSVQIGNFKRYAHTAGPFIFAVASIVVAWHTTRRTPRARSLEQPVRIIIIDLSTCAARAHGGPQLTLKVSHGQPRLQRMSRTGASSSDSAPF